MNAFMEETDTIVRDSRVASSAYWDYERAVQKGMGGVLDLLRWFSGKKIPLLALDDFLRCNQPIQRQDIGLQTVAINQIKGSVGRSEDFDGAFMPLQWHTSSRWISVDRAYHRSSSLPPVELWKVGGIYFVADGHHRISVASLHRQAYIDAYVTNIEVEKHC